MNELSVKINLVNKHCLIIGNGKVGKRKQAKLEKYGAIVDMDTKTRNLEQYFLVVLATDDKKLHQQIINKLQDTNVLINDCSSKENKGVTFLDNFSYLDYELTVSNKKDHQKRTKFKTKLLQLLSDNNVT